jgi:hypothetical protein
MTTVFPDQWRSTAVSLIPALSKYSSLNDPDDFKKIERLQGSGTPAPPGVIADFPFHAAWIMTIAAGDALLIKDLFQHAVMELDSVLRGE